MGTTSIGREKNGGSSAILEGYFQVLNFLSFIDAESVDGCTYLRYNFFGRKPVF